MRIIFFGQQSDINDRREWCSPPHPGYAAVVIRRSRDGVFQPATRWSSRPIGRFGYYIRPSVTAVLCLTCQAAVCGVGSLKHPIGLARAIYSAFEGEEAGLRSCNRGSKQQDGDQWHEPGSLHEAILPRSVSRRNPIPEPPIQINPLAECKPIERHRSSHRGSSDSRYRHVLCRGTPNRTMRCT